MSIIFKEITDQAEWDDFVFARQFYSFLQSFNWAQFQELNGAVVFKLGGYLNDKLVGLALVIKVSAKRGTFLLCPHGPLVEDDYQTEFFRELTGYLKILAKKEQADFIRLSPVLENTKANAKMLEGIGYRFAPMHVHAETTWLLNLSQPEDKLMADLRKTTRYLIKRAENEGVEITADQSNEAIERFIATHRAHAQKTHYEPFSAAYIRNLFKVFKSNEISLKFAVYQGQAEAASIIVYFGKTAVYYLAATNTLHPQFSPSYLLQWRSILEAKQRGCVLYNFWGVSPDNNPRHPIAGVSRFKMGFSGYKLDLLHAYDLPITGKYWLNWLVESGRRIARHYYFLKPLE